MEEIALFNDFQQVNLFRPTVFDSIVNMLVALLCGLIISLVYRFTYKGPSYSSTFVHSLVLLTLITSIVLLVIGNNLARAFGLVGAMSIIRFRTAVRDTLDILFIFFALAIGMAAGVGLTSIALLGTVFVSLVIIALTGTGYGQRRRRRNMLQISYESSDASDEELMRLLRIHARSINLVNIRQRQGSQVVEAFYHFSFRWRKNQAGLLRELNAAPFVESVNIFFDEDDENAPTMI
jgi:uncharacterized membrane protein YhiD involved in acid resistance